MHRYKLFLKSEPNLRAKRIGLSLSLATNPRNNYYLDINGASIYVSEERLQRVREQLPDIGYVPEKIRLTIDEMASRGSLFEGRQLLRTKCVQCHDLRTILARPRTAKNWRDTVERMVDRAAVVTSFSEQEKWQITAYLIAITPTLQNSMMEQKKQQSASADTMNAIKKVGEMLKENTADFDVVAAREVFETKCSLCHSPDLALNKSFGSGDEVTQLVTRMVSNGLVASTSELEQVMRFLLEHHNLSSASTVAQPVEDAQDVATNTLKCQPSLYKVVALVAMP